MRTSIFDDQEYASESARLADFQSKLSALDTRIGKARQDQSDAARTASEAKAHAIFQGKPYSPATFEDVETLQAEANVYRKVVAKQQ